MHSCDICKSKDHTTWARTYDDKGNTLYVCRLCWEAQYPCELNPNFIKIPYKMKCALGWTLTTNSVPVTVIPGEYEIGVIDAGKDVVTIWVYSDEVKPVTQDLPMHITNIVANEIRQQLLASTCSGEEGLRPVIMLYSFLKEYGIFFHKDTHIKNRCFN